MATLIGKISMLAPVCLLLQVRHFVRLSRPQLGWSHMVGVLLCLVWLGPHLKWSFRRDAHIAGQCSLVLIKWKTPFLIPYIHLQRAILLFIHMQIQAIKLHLPHSQMSHWNNTCGSFCLVFYHIEHNRISLFFIVFLFLHPKDLWRLLNGSMVKVTV